MRSSATSATTGMVGGTGSDTMYGGWGNDLLQRRRRPRRPDASTSPTTARARRYGITWLNDGAGHAPELRGSGVYGGAGLDVLIGNTGGDRLIDWVGEFNSYIVPFAPFGIATVSRQVEPQAARVPVRAVVQRGRRPDPRQRPGRQRRDAQGAQRRAVRRDRPDRPAGPRLLAGADRRPDRPAGRQHPGRQARHPASAPTSTTARCRASRSTAASGRSSSGTLQVAAASLGQDAAAVFYADVYLPIYYEIAATMLHPEADRRLEVELVRHLRLLVADRLQVRRHRHRDQQDGHRPPDAVRLDRRRPGAVHRLAQVRHLLRRARHGQRHGRHRVGQRLAGLLATRSQPRTSSTATTVGLNKGLVGFGSDNSRGVLDNLAVQAVPPAVTLDSTEYFEDGTADQFTGAAERGPGR